MATEFNVFGLEKVHKAFPEWMQKNFNIATDLINKGKVETVGERQYRIPAMTVAPGRFGTYNPRMGDMGRGTSSQGVEMLDTYFPLRFNFELDNLSIKATSDSSRAILNAMKDTLKRGFPEFMKYIDKAWHGDGTAVMARAVSHAVVSGKSVYTFDDNFGVQRLVRGQYVNVYDTTLATQLAQMVIEKINYGSRTATLSGTVPGAAATDAFCFDGVTGASPAGLHGLYYWNSNATSGTTLGVNRADEPEIIANHVPGSAGAISPEMVMAIYDKGLMRRGEFANKLIGFAAPAQRAAIVKQVLAIQNYDISNGVKAAIERLPKLRGRKVFNFGDVVHHVDIHQNWKRMDYTVPEDWGRVRLGEMDFYKLAGSGQRFFHLTGGSGAPAAGVWFSLTVEEQFHNRNPGVSGFIDDLTLPTLYQ